MTKTTKLTVTTPVGTFTRRMHPRHPLADLGIKKSSLVRTFNEWYDRPVTDAWSERVKGLLAERRTAYNVSELEDLVEVLDTSHHQCVLENSDDYHRLVVLAHERLEERIRNMGRQIEIWRRQEVVDSTIEN